MTSPDDTPPRGDRVTLAEDAWTKMPAALHRDPDATKAVLAVYAELYLAGWQDREITQEEIAEVLTITDRTVQRAAGWLEEHGWIERHVRRHGAVTVGTDYVIHDRNVAGDPTQMSGGDPTGMSGHTSLEDLSKKETVTGDTNVGLFEPPPPVEPTVGFAEFWTRYPRKVGKKDAARAWSAAVKDTEPQAIVDGLEAQLPALLARDTQYRPHPATWLRQGRWDDEVDVQATLNETSGGLADRMTDFLEEDDR